jgi:dienelactone hydrolase
MIGDGRAAVDVIGAARTVDTTRPGYLGMSMGTRFDLLLGAALGSQLHYAVLGKFYLRQASDLYDGTDMSTCIRSDGGQLKAPVLFHIHWDDELFFQGWPACPIRPAGIARQTVDRLSRHTW